MTIPRERVVVDNNVLVSRLLLAHSIPGQAVRKIVEHAQLLVSEATVAELADVLARAQFDPYVTVAERQEFLQLLLRVAEIVPITHTVRACRDPKDDKFLELAVNGGASVIVTGDKDLLALIPFQDIPIIQPARYLKR